MKTFLKAAQLHGELRLFDRQFARHLTDVNGAEVPELLLASALISHAIAKGDTCLALDSVKGSSLYTNPALRVVRQKLPPVEKWRKVLLEQKVVSTPPEIIQSDDESANNSASAFPTTPLVLDDNDRLYLSRYWVLERALIASVNSLLDREPPVVDQNKLSTALAALFTNDESPDWQKAAVANAVISNFCVITGGPGTGKTYTVTALLAALIDQGVDARRIALAAPTGKASTRLTQSIHNDLSGLLQKLGLPDVSFESVTLHRLLGARPGRVQPARHKNSPLPYDLVIIDEASMIDLPMMSRTFDALADDARIVLIGDKDQLHSVESGMVLGDICGGRSRAELSVARCNLLSKLGAGKLPACATPGGRISDQIIYLEKSHRVQDDGGISALAAAVNAGNVESALKLLISNDQPNLSLLPHEPASLDQLLRDVVVPACIDYAKAKSAPDALRKMTETGVLCALRHGPSGALRINALVEKMLTDDGAILAGDRYYHGQPIIVTENSNTQRLHNGDYGLVLADSNNVLSVHFATDDATVEHRTISPKRLPQHETFYAMTIHKSQGSEYSTVIVVLPETDSPILSRELLYTAITRARDRVIILANVEQLRSCIEKRSVRQSGLQDVFWTETEAEVPLQTAEPETLQRSGVVSESVKEAPAVSKTANVKKEKPTPPVQQTLDF